MAQQILGRKEEQRELESLYSSGRPEFVAVYGRRRVGKTFLIREMFRQRLCFYHTGLSPAELDEERLKEQQLAEFHRSLVQYGSKAMRAPADWFEAFGLLRQLIESRPAGRRQVVFIDEMPWMDTPRAGFITALEHFWNGWGAGRQNLMLIVCGSATTWMSDKLINNHGGLYNRLTSEIRLQPFTLAECEAFYKAHHISMDHYDQMQSYMIFGGIPYYLSLLQPGKSLSQNVDGLLFAKDGKLRSEFGRLYRSLFKNADDCMAIVRLLAKRHSGYTRKEIAAATRLPYGGGMTNTLRSLQDSGFITATIPYQSSSRQTTYQLTDFFSLFYLTFVDGQKTSNPTFWTDNLGSPRLTAWRGFAFERVCFAHALSIRRALGISGVQCEVAPWQGSDGGNGAQVDMVIDRSDRIVNVCEIKFCISDFIIDKAIDANLRNKLDVFQRLTKTRKALHLTLITTYGLHQNEYAGKVQRVITMDELF